MLCQRLLSGVAQALTLNRELSHVPIMLSQFLPVLGMAVSSKYIYGLASPASYVEGLTVSTTIMLSSAFGMLIAFYYYFEHYLRRRPNFT